MKARWLLQENNLDASFENAKAATAADPLSVDAHMALAIIQERRGDKGAAIRSYTEALRIIGP